MSTEIKIEVAEFEAKCKKLNALLKSGMSTKEEWDKYRKNLVKELRY